jgi:hypothetical protein
VRIRGTAQFGEGAGPLGDVNGDRRADVLVTVQDYVGHGRTRESLALILGRRRRAGIQPRRLGAEGYRIAIPAGNHLSGAEPAGDVNGDGLADFRLGTDPYDTRVSFLRTYVILGTRGRPPGSLAALGAGGFVIR